ILRRHAQIRRTGGAVGRAGGRAGRHLQPRDDHILAAHRPAPPHGTHAAGAVPATAHAAATAVEPGGAGPAVPAGPRGRRDARPGARSREAAAHRAAFADEVTVGVTAGPTGSGLKLGWFDALKRVVRRDTR